MSEFESRLEHIETLLIESNKMSEKRMGDLETSVYGNGKEGLRTIAVTHHNRLMELEKYKAETSVNRHNYGLLAVSLILGCVCIGVTLALLAQMGVLK